MNCNGSTVKWNRSIELIVGLSLLALLILIHPAGTQAAGPGGVANGDFENGATGWTCKGCTLTTGAPAQTGAAAQLTTTRATGRAQLFQGNIALQPNTTYEFKFWARSQNGANLEVTLLQQVLPFANYGIESERFDLTPTGQEYTLTFTTALAQPVTDARLRFRADRGKGLAYSIDNVSLTPVDAPPPPTGLDDEILVFNRGSLSTPFTITKAMSGFIMDQPAIGAANANWVTGEYAGFADGTLYYRARIISIPVDQPGMKLGFCFWEQKYDHEECRGQVIDGIPGTELTWQHELSDMWVKDQPINWANPRTKHGFIVRNDRNKPVSAKKGWNWNGEDPDEWYSMDIHYTVVLVKEGGSFDGWQNYGW